MKGYTRPRHETKIGPDNPALSEEVCHAMWAIVQECNRLREAATLGIPYEPDPELQDIIEKGGIPRRDRVNGYKNKKARNAQILLDLESGLKVKEIAKKHNLTSQMIYYIKKQAQKAAQEPAEGPQAP